MKIVNCQTLGDMCKCMLDGEPVFLIRAQDKLAWDAVNAYLNLAKEHKGLNITRVRDVLDDIHDWQQEHKNKVKIPD